VLTTTLAASAPSTPSAAQVVAGALYYLGLSVAGGAGLLAAYLAPTAPGVLLRKAFRLGVPVAAFVAVTAVINFVAAAAKSVKTSIAGALDPRELISFITAAPSHGSPIGAGQVALIQTGVYLLLVLALISMSRQSSRRAAAAVIVLTVLTALVPNIPLGGVNANGVANAVLTSVHLAGVLAWVGGLIVLAVVGLLTRTENASPTEQLSEDWGSIWVRYSTVALWAVGMIVVSGSWLAWTHVGSPVQLLTTPYGRYLAVKLVLVLGMLTGGGYNTRVLLPRIQSARDADDHATLLAVAAKHFPKVVLVEGLLGVGVLLIVPFLAGSARAQAGWPSARSFDFTVFGTGAVLVGLVAIGLWAGTRTTSGRTRAPAVSA
jgi:putative copper export protein